MEVWSIHNNSEQVKSSTPAPRYQGLKKSKTSDEIVEGVREELKRQKKGSQNEDEEWLMSLV